ncbi:glycosyltransferase [Rhodoflexus sp.]
MLIGIAIVYALLVAALCYGWHRTEFPAHKAASDEGLSIIVAMRNEALNIPQLLACLRMQVFDGQLEIILVDDHSTDASVAIARACAVEFPYPLRIITSLGQGKKAAISTGLACAQFSLILTTDADCQMGRLWAQTMYAALQTPGTNLVTGIVKIAPTGTWAARFQAIELAALMGSTAAFATWKMPNMGNGANLGYRKAVFDKIGGYATSAHIASGDDEFLIQQVHQAAPGSVRFVKDEKAIVCTAPQADYRSLLMQRRRWAAKWNQGRPLRVWGVALMVGLFHLYWALLPIGILFLPEQHLEIIAAFSLKLIAEYVFLKCVLSFIRQEMLVPYIFPLQTCYSFYVVWVGLQATRGGYVWKERVFTR